MSAVPQRPPRRTGAVSNTKSETRSAGLLVDVVRTLTTSPSQAQKELQKERFEKDFAITCDTIDRLLTDHQQDLTTSLQSFRKVSAKLSNSIERVRSLKNNLSSCKSLLQCKRDELKQLWFEAAEQNRVVNLLERIESVRSVPYTVSECITKKQFFHASQLLKESDNNIKVYLFNIEGINEVKENVAQKTKETYETVLNEIEKQIYVKPLEELLYELRRLTSMRRASSGIQQQNQQQNAQQSQKIDNDSASSSSKLSLPGSLKSLSNVYSKTNEDDMPVLTDDGYAYEDPNDPSPDTNHVQYLSVLVESLGVLERLPDAMDALKHRIPKSLARLIQHTTLFIYEHFASSDQTLGDSKLLSELVQLLFRQFKSVSILHGIVINQAGRVNNNNKSVQNFQNKDSSNSAYRSSPFYTIEDVWREIQNALQQMLNDYLDVRGTTGTSGGGVVANLLISAAAGSNQPPTTSLSFYFSKRRPPAAKFKKSYFRFDSTAHSINVSAYSKEQKFLNLSFGPNATSAYDTESERLYVCIPTPDNVTVVFKPIMRFILEIEGKFTAPCPLRTYLEDYTREIYLPKIRSDTSLRLDAILQTSDTWDIVASSEEVKQLAGGQKTPLLSSTLKVVEICRNLENLMQSAPAFVENFAGLWLFVLDAYKHTVKNAYSSATTTVTRSIGSGGDNFDGVEIERRKVSAAWAVDEDISRLLKSLPNWMALNDWSRFTKNGPNSTPYTPGGPISAPTPTSTMNNVLESAQEIRLRNQRESEILISNLGMQKKIEDYEVIVDDPNRLRLLANMHESVEWFAREIQYSLLQLPPSIVAKLKEASLAIVEQSGQIYSNIWKEFEKCLIALDDMASTCLLMLHLEVRVHCFFYLLTVAKQSALGTSSMSSSHQEVDENVLRLNKDLVQLHELMSMNLQARKVKYVFEGLGHLISSIFINSCQHIPKINDGGKKRICRNLFAVQQCLSSITSSREQDLDLARKYFELLYKTPDEILNDIVENGPEFKELEYQNLLALAIRSHPIFSREPGTLEQRVTRLREIMTERRKQR